MRYTRVIFVAKIQLFFIYEYTRERNNKKKYEPQKIKLLIFSIINIF